MVNDSRTLIAVASNAKIILYVAKGIKITKTLQNIPIILENHHKHTKKDSLYQKKSAPGSLFEPHSSPKDLEHHEAAKQITNIIEKTINDNHDFKKLVIIAEPKMLGHIRQTINNNLKKIIIKEISKNLVDQDVHVIEQAVFS
ncbi:MAG: host attachment protein [Candidatus Rickettsia vulgarisii]